MANLSNEEKAFMNSLFNSYDLSMDDIFRHQHFVIIKRQGIEKIMAKAGITLKYDVEGCSEKYAAVRCTATNHCHLLPAIHIRKLGQSGLY